jgi:tetrahydromethanopterin S-methyltransferase subunit E
MNETATGLGAGSHRIRERVRALVDCWSYCARFGLALVALAVGLLLIACWLVVGIPAALLHCAMNKRPEFYQ